MEFELINLIQFGINEFKSLLLLVGMDSKRLLLNDLMMKGFKGWPVSSIVLFIFRCDYTFIVLPKAFLSRHNSGPKLLHKRKKSNKCFVNMQFYEFSQKIHPLVNFCFCYCCISDHCKLLSIVTPLSI